MTQTYSIAAVEPDMLDRLHVVNEAATPGVASVSREVLARLVATADRAIAAVDASGAPVGFLLLLGADAEHDSLNYAWFRRRAAESGATIAYVDRIAVDGALRGAGVGAMLYAAAIGACRGRFERIGCEVNLLPPNPGSLRFHQRLGFEEVGRQVFEPNEKAVVYLERAVAPAG